MTGASAQSKLVQLVVDFEPGAWTSLHTHGGQAINLVLEGEIKLRQNGVDRPHRAGESWTDSSSQVHAAGNTGSGKARLLTNFLLPPGAPEITVIANPDSGRRSFTRRSSICRGCMPKPTSYNRWLTFRPAGTPSITTAASSPPW